MKNSKNTPVRYNLLLLFFILSPPNALADAFCHVMPVDPEWPAGLAGRYEIVGKNPQTGRAYTGTLNLSYGKNDYELTRSIGKKSIPGRAHIERCGLDQITFLSVRYDSAPVTEALCSLASDGDNYCRITCRTRIPGQSGFGLEAWFQQPDE